MTRMKPSWLALLLLVGSGLAHSQEIRESDLYFADRGNLARLIEQAEQERRAGRVEAALLGLGTVIDTTRDASEPELRQLYLEALSLRANVHLQRKQRGSATADIEALLRADPSAGLSEPASTSLQRLFAEVRSGLVGRLTVHSHPTGARVIVDGRRLGLTPLDSAPVLLGKRLLKITRAGFEPIFEEVTVERGAIAKVSRSLERRTATFLLLTNADDARVSIDGHEVGRAQRPDRQEAEDLIAAYNLPVDPFDPPSLFLWPNATPGLHQLKLEARCHQPLERVVEVPDGADSTTMAPMRRTGGELRVEGALDLRVQIDGGTPQPPPVIATDLCPGPHLIEAEDGAGRRTRFTTVVLDGRTTTWPVRFRPVLAALQPTPAAFQAMSEADSFNVTIVEVDPASLFDPAGRLIEARRDTVAFAHQAALLAFEREGEDGRQLGLLAADSPNPDWLPADLPGLEQVAALLDGPLPLVEPILGIGSVETHLADTPIVAFVRTTPPSPAVRAGDVIELIGGKPMSRLADLDATAAGATAALEATVVRSVGETRVLIPVQQSALDLEFRHRGMPPNIALARLSMVGEGPALDQARQRMARAKSLLEVRAWDRAYAAYRAIDPAPLTSDEIGRLLYYRGVAAMRSGLPIEAATSLRQALNHPQARLGGADGPPLIPLAQQLLHELAPRTDPMEP